MQQLLRLQGVFAQACNVLAGVVVQNRCWNRVALHHLAYHRLREQFPALGSQMACNAIYSVCRMARLIYQGPKSPWSIEKRPDAPLPRFSFTANAPVYFDRHTLSVREGGLSMYSLDGRLHFSFGLKPKEERLFREGKLKEVVLSRDATGFRLVFCFGEMPSQSSRLCEMPEYVVVLESTELVV